MKVLFFKEGRKLSKGAKTFILFGMVGLLVLTGYLNVKLSNKKTSTNVSTTTTTITTTSANFFVTYRSDRTETRGQEIDILDAIISNASSTTEAKSQAEKKKMSLLELMEKELVLEGLIKSQGFNDVVVTSGTENYNVIVKSKELSAADVAKILDIVVSETKCSARCVKIIPIE